MSTFTKKVRHRLYKIFALNHVRRNNRKITATMPRIDLDPKHVQNGRLLANRNELLENLPKNAVCAEIGVDEGHFSNEIINRTNPSKFHLIDIWARMHAYKKGEVTKRFQKQIDAGIVEIHHGFSTDVVGSFEDEYFDWVYIDADHFYKSTLNELKSFAPKIKTGGYICGHDYSVGSWDKVLRYGVREAVHEFCRDEGWEFVYLTIELTSNPSFALRKL